LAPGHSPPAPLPLRQDKNKICSYNKKITRLLSGKKKSIHHITRHIWLRLSW